LKRLIGLAVVAAAALWIIPSAFAGTITTVPQWNGTDGIDAYGATSTPTYGQTVVGNGQNLQSFTFYINAEGGSVTARGGIGVWDGSEVTSVVWMDSSFQTITGSSYTQVTFTPNVTLQSGVTYVLFATARGDGGGGGADWGFLWTGGDPYASGGFVYTNDSTPSYLTNAWDGSSAYSSYDLAFSMQFGSADFEITQLGYCSVAGNTWADGTPIPPGTFLSLETGQPSSDPDFTGATPAFYYQGLGLSCDHLSGYTPTGELVGPLGEGSGGLYPYFEQSS
jgi:hypothetical protein